MSSQWIGFAIYLLLATYSKGSNSIETVINFHSSLPESTTYKTIYRLQNGDRLNAYKVYNHNGELLWKVSIGHFKGDSYHRADALNIFDNQGHCIEKIYRTFMGYISYSVYRTELINYSFSPVTRIPEIDRRGIAEVLVNSFPWTNPFHLE